MWLITTHHCACPEEPMQTDIQQSITDLTKIFVEQEVHLFPFIVGAEIKIMKESDVERLHYNQYIKVPLHTHNNIFHI